MRWPRHPAIEALLPRLATACGTRFNMEMMMKSGFALVRTALMFAALLIGAVAPLRAQSDPVPTLVMDVRAFAVAGDDVYVGGRFVIETRQGIAVNLARWDGEAWNTVGELGPDAEVLSLAWDAARQRLYVGGAFQQIDGLAARHIASWDAAQRRWQAMQGGATRPVVRMAVNGVTGQLAVGESTTLGPAPLAAVRLWDGSVWTEPASIAGILERQGGSSEIRAFAWENGGNALLLTVNWKERPMGIFVPESWGELHRFSAGSLTQLARFWVPYATRRIPTRGTADTLAVDPSTGDIYVGGLFEGVASSGDFLTSPGWAILRGGQWRALDARGSAYANVPLDAVWDARNRRLIAISDFEGERDLSVFENGQWQPLLARRSAVVSVVAVGARGRELLVGGPFTRIGSQVALGRALHDGQRWRAFGASSAAREPLGNGLPKSLTLAAGDSHRGLFIDVPPGMQRLTVRTTSNANIDLRLARVDAPSINPDIPRVAAAPPADQAQFRADGPSGDETLVVETPTPGRWYVTPTNASATRASLSVRAELEGVGGTTPRGAYFNPARSGHGLFIYPAGAQWAAVWFTYLADSTPTWLYLQSTAPRADGQWRAPIFRSTGFGLTGQNALEAVGEATLTPNGGDRWTFSYSVDGQTGSESLVSFGGGCPTIGGTRYDLSGLWFNSFRSGTGYGVQLFPNYQFHAFFDYDDEGLPRFLVAEGPLQGTEASTLALQQMTGACPLCARSGDPARVTVATMERRIPTPSQWSYRFNGFFAWPVKGGFVADELVQPLGGPASTQGCAAN